MATLNISRTRQRLNQFEFGPLFLEELGWSRPSSREPVRWIIEGEKFERRQIAQLGGVAVFEVTAGNGLIPSAKSRASAYQEIVQRHHENLVIFVDRDRTQSLWYWMKRDKNRNHAREHLYVKGQSGDLFLSKLSALVVDLTDLDERGNIAVTEVASRLRRAMDIERVTKEFYKEFERLHVDFTALIDIKDSKDQAWYASVLLNRLMFIYFLQKKGFLDGGRQEYLQEKLLESRRRGPDQFYREFLRVLFFQGFARPENDRTAVANALLGRIKYLNGGLFLEHPIEVRWPEIQIPDQAFENLFDLFGRYSWNLDDTPGGDDRTINPDVLGYIFEKYINQKEFGAYYTHPAITGYLCEQTIQQVILDRVNHDGIPGVLKPQRFERMEDLLTGMDGDLCVFLLTRVLPELTVLDPACGSGAFLVAAMKMLFDLYQAVITRSERENDSRIRDWRTRLLGESQSLEYALKRHIIAHNLFGVDIMPEAMEIARLRLFLALVSSAKTVQELDPLPNIDFNILPGNSLIGLLQVKVNSADRLIQQQMYRPSYYNLLEEKSRLLATYRDQRTYAPELKDLRNQIDALREKAQNGLNESLRDEFRALKIQFEQAEWIVSQGKLAKPRKRPLTLDDVRTLQPFHWGFEFSEVMVRGGFDVVIANPPWDIFKPNAREFFQRYSDLMTKRKMDIKAFEKAQEVLLGDSEVLSAWNQYQSQFPHQSAYYRSAEQFKNQIAVINGRKAGSDINLYKLFLEQAFNLLRPGGRCGIIVPSGIYTDLGAKQLREMIFEQSRLSSLFGLANERFIFDEVDHRFKFCILNFEKGGRTETFSAAFRVDPREAIRAEDLGKFLHDSDEHVQMSVPLVRKLSPDSLSVMEFHGARDIRIAEKMLRFPLLGDPKEGTWNLVLSREFDMTNDSYLFKTEFAPSRLPLVEGKMIHQFDTSFAAARYWIEEGEGRAAVLGKQSDQGQSLDYQDYRLGFRRIARNTDERTMIAAILAARHFASESLNLSMGMLLGKKELLYIVSILNSLTVDYSVRQRVSANLNMFHIYQLPVPRLTDSDPRFMPIVVRAARLTCIGPEFDDLAQAAGLRDHRDGVMHPLERARLRAELDGLVAHLYGLTEEEFAHILSTFPVVPEPVRVAAQNAWRDVEKGLIV